LLAWSRKFQSEETADTDYPRPWFLIVVQRARFFDAVQICGLAINRAIDNALRRISFAVPLRRGVEGGESVLFERLFDLALLALGDGAAVWIILLIRTRVPVSEVGWVFVLGLITAVRVMLLTALASLVWVPIGVWIGLRPTLAERAQPIVQFLAAFPANLFF